MIRRTSFLVASRLTVTHHPLCDERSEEQSRVHAVVSPLPQQALYTISASGLLTPTIEM